MGAFFVFFFRKKMWTRSLGGCLISSRLVVAYVVDVRHLHNPAPRGSLSTHRKKRQRILSMQKNNNYEKKRNGLVLWALWKKKETHQKGQTHSKKDIWGGKVCPLAASPFSCLYSCLHSTGIRAGNFMRKNTCVFQIL
nr:hypothetical protein [Pandoravirus massiliensis]